MPKYLSSEKVIQYLKDKKAQKEKDEEESYTVRGIKREERLERARKKQEAMLWNSVNEVE